jgi:hypothetical protein
VIFSLYLLGDAFYRWDGFRYYASFSEFLPSLALTSVLWSIIAVFVAILVWLQFWILKWLCIRVKCKKNIFYLLLVGIFEFLGASVWIGKIYLWHDAPTTPQIKLIVFVCVALVTIFLAWLLRNRAEWFINIIQDRITPLVWLFSIFIILSIPLVGYHTWWKTTDKLISQNITSSSVETIDQPNIILVTFDALTTRDMSVYGYYRETTPFINEWSRSASLFKNAEAASNYTLPTVSSLLTGKRLWTHGSYHSEGGKIVRNIENIAWLMKKNGYYNKAYITNHVASVQTLGMSHSFDFAPPIIGLTMKTSSLFEITTGFLNRLFAGKIQLYNWILQEDFILYRFFMKISPRHAKTIRSLILCGFICFLLMLLFCLLNLIWECLILLWN